ncbi:HAD-IA family hydrolase [Saccharopolyspora sp. HNM0983]|uniref:HAD-IA family hydrolase n=1 Tax=Saccharopolyspora montiporae TaxID=2781240 RepID=A0A929G1I6_9PSEU|nr:HAD-IA family hydrolase [Saccharopolyspora sp. HNM0983]MBE9376344.1 HAD-IA family hydrolase [Saccharopolyspora sp. HNM0983]
MALRGLLLDWGGVLDDPGDPPGNGAEDAGFPGAAQPGAGPLIEVARRVRGFGVRTGLVSNSVPWDGPNAFDAFDALVFSGDPAVGAGKPDPAVYLIAARRIGVEPDRCAFVDDQRDNVLGAVRAGMVGVHHREVTATAAEIAVLFELDMRDDLR